MSRENLVLSNSWNSILLLYRLMCIDKKEKRHHDHYVKRYEWFQSVKYVTDNTHSSELCNSEEWKQWESNDRNGLIAWQIQSIIQSHFSMIQIQQNLFLSIFIILCYICYHLHGQKYMLHEFLWKFNLLVY